MEEAAAAALFCLIFGVVMVVDGGKIVGMIWLGTSIVIVHDVVSLIGEIMILNLQLLLVLGL